VAHDLDGEVGTIAIVLQALVMAGAPPVERDTLPRRVRRIVLHVPGNAAYEAPERRWVFLDPRETQRLWRARFGAHWIVWTDGSIWPRHPGKGDNASYALPAGGGPADRELRRRLAREALPIYSHVYHGNSSSLGIEVSHSGRADDPFPPLQVRSLARFLRILLDVSGGRLTAADIYGHKDLDCRPAYASPRCDWPGCPVFVDQHGRPYRRRLDPPEGLFAALAGEGLVIPRAGREGDGELRRAEALGRRPASVAGR
jgi:hypothetical protein